MYSRSVNSLVLDGSLSSHRHSYTLKQLVRLGNTSSIHNTQTILCLNKFPQNCITPIIDVKTGLLTGLLGGKQGWKYPVSLVGLRFSSLPCPQTSFPTNIFGGLRRAPKVRDGGVFHTPCADFSRPVEELEYTGWMRLIFFMSHFQVSQALD